MLSELGPQDCRLIPEAHRALLVSAFGRLLSLYRLIEAECDADFRPASSWEALTQDIQQIRSKLNCERYSVGFLGPFQCGKSHTFNRLAKAEVCKTGNSGATTSTITRLRPQEEGQNSLTLNFLSKDQYAHLRQESLENFKLRKDASDERILVEVEQLRRNAVDQATNLGYLHFLLRCHKRFGDELGTTKKNVAYESRNLYTSHPNDWLKAGEVQTPLLRDVMVHFTTNAIPPSLEMIDLPGLGSTFSADDQLTDEYLKQLDGALVFCQSASVTDKNVEKLLSRLSLLFGNRLKDRVWVICTRADMLAGQLFGESTLFDVIARFFTQAKVPLDRICFICNLPERLTPLPSAADIPALSKPELAPLRSAWNTLMTDGEGGLSRLRPIIEVDVPYNLGQSLATESREKLTRAARELIQIGKEAVETGPGSDETLSQGNPWLNELKRLNGKLQNHREGLRAVSARVREVLFAKLDAQHIAPEVLRRQSDFQEQFARSADDLDRALRRLVRSELVALAYREPKVELERLEDKLDVMRVPPSMPHGLVKAWEEFCDEDRNLSALPAELLPSFVRHDPFVDGEERHEHTFTGESFLALLREKVDITGGQLAQILRSCLRRRIAQLETRLKAFLDTRSRNRSFVPSERLKQELDQYQDLVDLVR